MKKASLWSIIILLALLVYVIFTLLFYTMLREFVFNDLAAETPVLLTPTLAPTFTPAPTETPLEVVVIPTATPTPTPTTPPTATATPTPTPVIPQAVTDITVNVRSGPGTNYPVIGALTPAEPVTVTGQNEAGSWWHIRQADGTLGWVAGSVVETQHTTDLPIVLASPPPAPTATPTAAATPTPTKSPYQYEPTGWYGDRNYGLTRFLGNISDAQGNPVNGVFVEAQCGSYRVISNPSGPIGWPPFNESSTWPPGFYDITVARHPVPCQWLLTVVLTEDRETVLARLSETIEVEVTVEQSIIVANWRKNW